MNRKRDLQKGRSLLFDIPKIYFLFEALLAAFNGLIRTLIISISGFAWVAKLQNPNFHFAAGYR